ncbi:alkaline phosphatase [soil metagenome]
MTSEVFAHSVASFEPTASGVLLWTRLGREETHAGWVLAGDPDLTDVVATGSATTGAADDYTITVDVGDLAPLTTYWYRFSAGGEQSPVGRTRTLPAGPADSFRIGTVSCAHYSVAPLGVYRALAEREVDLVLHLGDYLYEDDGHHGPRDHDPPHAAITQDDYRRRLAQLRTDPDLRALHLRHPMIAIWDDHDLSDNAWREGAKHHDPDRDGPWAVRVASAAAARQEWLPARLRDPADPKLIWRSVAIGELAELVLLDTRYVGRDLQAGTEGAPALHDPARSLLGEPQRRWLRERLADVSRPWSIVANGVVVNSIELPWPLPLRSANRLLPNGYAMFDGRVMHDDQWDGYPAERERVVRWIDDRGRAGGRTVLLSADVHSSWAFTGPCDASGQPVAVEFTTPAVSSAAMGRAHYPGLWRLLDDAVDELDHVAWAEVTERGYTVLTITPDQVASEWWFVHPYDQDPAATAELGAAFVTARTPWPPALARQGVGAPDPVRPGLTAPLPDRPVDLPRIRRRRTIRVGAEGASLATVAAGTLAAGAALVRWAVQRRH